MTYVDVVRRRYPMLPATRPVPAGLDLRHAAHLLLHEPIHLDSQGYLWITRAEAPGLAEHLATAADQSVNVVPWRLLYVHWHEDRDGRWTPQLVAQTDPGGGACEVIGVSDARPPVLLRRTLAGGPKLQWDRAFAWHGPDLVVVPTDAGVSIFEPARQWRETASPPLLPEGQHGQVQALLDARGLIAWVPSADGAGGADGVARYVDGQWTRPGAADGWAGSLLHVIPLRDGSVLQIVPAGEDRVKLRLASVDPPRVSERVILDLIDKLGHEDQTVRDEAYAQLTCYAQALWPILERAMKDQIAEVRLRLRELLKSKLAPTLGGMSLVGDRLRIISRQRDGGVLMYAPDGVLRPGAGEEPDKIAPAWIVARPGDPVRLLDPPLVAQLDADRVSVTRFGDDWLVIDNQDGVRYLLGNDLVPLTRKSERAFTRPIGLDRQGRWLLRRPATGTTMLREDTPTLLIDPTLPDPAPRLPVWLIQSEGAAAGWTRDHWPAQRRSGGPWALSRDGWRALKEEDPLYTSIEQMPAELRAAKLPTRAPTTLPAALADVPPDRMVRDGERLWTMPRPGRIELYAALPGQGLSLQAAFTHRIPASDEIRRFWLDPAGRLVIAHDTDRLAILFPQGFIPPAIWNLMPAEQQDAAIDDPSAEKTP